MVWQGGGVGTRGFTGPPPVGPGVDPRPAWVACAAAAVPAVAGAVAPWWRAGPAAGLWQAGPSRGLGPPLRARPVPPRRDPPTALARHAPSRPAQTPGPGPPPPLTLRGLGAPRPLGPGGGAGSGCTRFSRKVKPRDFQDQAIPGQETKAEWSHSPGDLDEKW
ncbi:sterile alpha motif domain-containing protein 1-like [Neofelis nebulosa]|uniref:sterile alpha motif domain-containing protein 1-like n=1 Tax=Neofelis nebulosa TaxID=61452 RepID=UPI00272A0123|nr:sterile alpha motif domain-containing protein 1-like [Neofelis nebulosa]